VLARQQKELEEVKEEAAAMIRRAEEKLQDTGVCQDSCRGWLISI
jgi:hypothetical protein